VAKAGITATLQSRCSVLGAANPKMGRFDEFASIAEQINFPPALLSRFDVIFILRDQPDAGRDALLAKFILNVHRGGAMLEQIRHEDSLHTEDEVDLLLARTAPPVAKDFLRKFVAYAKRTCHPVLTEDARDRLVTYYVDLRRQGSGEDNKAIPLTARQLEALVRLSESSARVRLSPEVSPEDTDRAIGIFEYYMKRIGGGEGGIMDIDMVASGVSHSQRQSVGIVKGVIRRLEAGTDHGAEYSEVVRECEREGVAPDKVQSIVERLKQQGEAYSPRENHLKLTGR
jgi:replicative DNA helicase Mcm